VAESVAHTKVVYIGVLTRPCLSMFLFLFAGPWSAYIRGVSNPLKFFNLLKVLPGHVSKTLGISTLSAAKTR
jgi:hypothetical protein